MRVIFSIYVDIPEDRLDNPASWNNKTGEQEKTDKSKNTKEKFLLYKDQLIERQRAYAELCGATYQLFEGNDMLYEVFADSIRKSAPQISEYDIVNFFKHHMMRNLAEVYDEVCYFDLDIVPLTQKNIFEEFDMDKFNVPESNAESMWGRKVEIEYYNACIRSPAAKWFNAQAMAFECEIEPLEDVFNTGIMIAGQDVIKNLDYFKDFQENIELMDTLKNESMYPANIQRSFGYDNETLFSHRLNMSETGYHTLPYEWHTITLKEDEVAEAELLHVISKEFDKVL